MWKISSESIFGANISNAGFWFFEHGKRECEANCELSKQNLPCKHDTLSHFRWKEGRKPFITPYTVFILMGLWGAIGIGTPMVSRYESLKKSQGTDGWCNWN